MIKGKIENGLHPKVRVEVAGKSASQKFAALVDTGFDLDFVKNKLMLEEPSGLKRKRK